MSAPIVPTSLVPTSLVPPTPQDKPPGLQLATDTSVQGGVDLQLCLPTYRDTFLASSIATLFLFAGLFALSISETSWPGLEKEHWSVLLFRILAWAALYYVPVQMVAILNLRSFAFYGISPGNSGLVCWRIGFGPSIIGEIVEEMGLSQRWWGMWWLLGPVALHSLLFMIYCALFLVYLGPHYQHCGFILAYCVGHVLNLVVGEYTGQYLVPEGLSPRYAKKMGPATLGVALVGFILMTTVYSVVKRVVKSSWLGILMPALLSCYEQGNLMVLQRQFVAEFVQERSVRCKYNHCNQGILVSVQVAMVHALAEGARMTMILADMSHSKGNYLDYLVPITSGVLWNIIVRAGLLDRAMGIVTCGRRTPTKSSLLLQEVKYCMGYPRFFTLLAVVLARMVSQNPVLPIGHENMAYAMLALFLSEVVEDLISYALYWLDIRVHPKRRQVTEEELEILAKAELLAELGQLSSRRDSTLSRRPTDTMSSAQSLKLKCWTLRESFAFSYGEQDLGILPFWAHFSAVMVSMFHTVLFMILLGNGLNYTLGFCHEELVGYQSGLLWWPVTNTNDLCA
eukprot:Skav227476  [mRNA]  locus=scaffold2491:468274:469977:+ [translate_table: standard]